jgi:rhamnosyl/mannosyltransferase
MFEPILLHTLKRCEAIIVASQKQVDESPVLSRFKERCRVIPYGISAARFGPCDLKAVRAIREQHGNRIVLAVGRLVYYKGFEYLIRAMRDVAAKLLIIGEGPLLVKLQREITRRGVGHRVAMLGAVRDLIPYYHAADVFALPSTTRAEAFGIVQLEAMACGKPVVNTHLPTGVPSVSLDGITGLTVPPAVPEALAKALNLLLGDPQLRLLYGSAGRHRVNQEFDEELMTARTLQLYQDICKRFDCEAEPVSMSTGK